MMTFDFETEYHWGALMVKLVPLFATDVYRAHEDDLVWVLMQTNLTTVITFLLVTFPPILIDYDTRTKVSTTV